MWNAVSSKQNTILLFNINIIYHLDEHALWLKSYIHITSLENVEEC